MAELVPDRLDISTGLANREDKQSIKPRCCQVTNILEWIRCFRICVAVLTLKHLDRIQDLLGYQALIVEACMEYNCEAWLGYDQRFWQDAAASSNTEQKLIPSCGIKRSQGRLEPNDANTVSP